MRGVRGHVCLRTASDAPLREVENRYGGPDALEDALEAFVLPIERWAKQMGRPPSARIPDNMGGSLHQLLEAIAAYGALGDMGGADPRVCRRLQPLLTRLVRSLLTGGLVANDNAEGSSATPLDGEALLKAAARAQSSCSAGPVRPLASQVLDVSWGGEEEGARGRQPNGPAGCPVCAQPGALQVTVSFADFASCETGAMLWAGAVGLSLYIMEHWHTYFPSPADPEGRLPPRRVLEVGCGPGLVSLTAAHLYNAHAAASVPCSPTALQWEVSDIAPDAVAEVCRAATVGGALPHVTVVSSPEEAGHASSEGKGFVFVPRVLDFASIPTALYGQFDLILGSDIVYDFAIAACVAPALEKLMKPSGMALLCCEAHRDGMPQFLDAVRAKTHVTTLEVVEEVADVNRLLSVWQLPPGVTESSCSLMILRKVNGA